MAGYINVSGDYRFDDYGIVHMLLKSNARRLHVRWKGGRLQVTAWPGVEYDHVVRFLKDLAVKIDQYKPPSLYYIGQQLQFPEFSVEISAQTHVPGKIIMRYDARVARVEVGSNWDMASHNTMQHISKFLCRVAQHIAPDALVPHARQVAERVGKEPLLWTISNGHRTLGHCNSKGVIALSYALVFYPLHLREYVICHELAHLTELNHGPQFHALCDLYCGGREAQLSEELKSYPLPIIK